MSAYDLWKTYDEFAEAAARDDLARERWMETYTMTELLGDEADEILLELATGDAQKARRMVELALDKAWANEGKDER